MTYSAIAAAERRVIQCRSELHGGLGRLGERLARPPSLVAAATAGALAGFAITRLGGLSALARTLGGALLRHGLEAPEIDVWGYAVAEDKLQFPKTPPPPAPWKSA